MRLTAAGDQRQAKIEGAEHMEYDEHHAYQSAKDIVRVAIDNYVNRGETTKRGALPYGTQVLKGDIRDPQSVQPQKARLVERPDPQNGALVERSGTAGGGPALYVGLDVHTDSIAVSLAPSDATEVRR